jgi:exosortase
MLLQASRPTTGSAGRLQLFDLSVLALLAVGYLPVFALYARQQWTGNTLQGAYGHAWVALLLVAWMLWRQRGVLLRSDAMAGGRNAWIWLSVGVLLKLYGDYHSYDVLRGVSLVPTLAGLAMLRFGARGWRELRFPVLFLLFVIPLPDAAIDAVTRPLIDATSIAVRGLLPWLGLDIGGAGPYLLLGDAAGGPVHELILAPECSGIRSLVALLGLASLLAHFQQLRAAGFVVMFVSTFLLTIAGNTLRIVLLALGMVYFSPTAAETAFHSLSGIFLFMVNLLGLLAISSWLARGRRRQT